MGISRTYIDSYYVIELITQGSSKQDVEHLLSKLCSNSFEIFIPQIVLGEILAKIFQKYKGNDLYPRLEKFGNIIQKHNICVDTCLVPPAQNSFTIMSELQKRDSILDPTDIVILSHVLADPDSKFFLTPDTKLIGNQEILAYEKELRSEGTRQAKLKISGQV